MTTSDAPNISFTDWYAEGRADKGEEPSLPASMTREERDAYIRVTDWQRRNPELTSLAACKKTLTDFAVYMRARRKAIASDGEAFGSSGFDYERRILARRLDENGGIPLAPVLPEGVGKVCTGCKQRWDIDEFLTYGPDQKRRPNCRYCFAAYMRAWGKKRREQQKAQKKLEEGA